MVAVKVPDLSGNTAGTTVGDPATSSEDNVNIAKMGGTDVTTGTGLLVAGEYNSTSPTLTNGQTDALQFDASGNLRIRLLGANGLSAGVDNLPTITSVQTSNEASSATVVRPLAVANHVYDPGGNNWDRQRGDTTAMFSKAPPLAKTDSAVSAASTTTQQLFAANATRAKLVIQNQDAAINVFVNIGAAAVAGANNLRIAPGATLELTGTSGAVNIIAASGTPAICAWQF